MHMFKSHVHKKVSPPLKKQPADAGCWLVFTVGVFLQYCFQFVDPLLKYFYQFRVKLLTRFLFNMRHYLLQAPGRFITAAVTQCVIHISKRCDAAINMYVFTFFTGRIASAVP